MKATLNFGKIAYNDNARINLVEVSIELRETNKGPEFSACAYVWNKTKSDIIMGGQCFDSLIKFPELNRNRLFQEVYDLHKKYHLNGLHAGTVKQEEYLAKYSDKRSYTQDRLLLEQAGLLIDDGYKYGTHWLYREIPAADLTRIEKLFSK